VQFPTGGKAHQPAIELVADRSGVIPEPTVKVWMKEKEE